jgi:hypothetical protein
VPLAEPHYVVVDGSNLATEGRTAPSLKQLDEAVRAYAAEDPKAQIIVVVDATFEHRVSDAEREAVRDAMLNGEVISPPAGAIGRGDAFVLRIAERTGATVLSNDSFQEFHGEHPWLFDEGRLIGGKPVPGVGWIFTPRLPIRGPKSRAATAEVRSRKDPASAPAKAAELARAAKKAAKKGAKAKRASKKSAPPVDTSWPLTPASPPPRAKLDPVFSSAIDEAVEEALHPAKPQKPKGASKKTAAAKKAPSQKSAKAKKEVARKRGDTRADAPSTRTDRTRKKQRAVPPPAVNEPLAFINFVAAFPVGSTIEGEVVSFTSHGAMVDVPLPGGGSLHCYIPLAAMGTPPPTKARQVLKKGEVRSFVLAGLDPPRRVAELALPAGRAVAVSQRAAGKKGTPADKKPAGSDKAAPQKAAKKSQASAKKAGAPPAKAAKAAKAAKKSTSTKAAKKVTSAKAVKKAAKKVAKKAGGAKKSTKKRAAAERS